MSEVNRNTLYNDKNQIRPIVDKTSTGDKTSIENLTNSFVQLIKDKHL